MKDKKKIERGNLTNKDKAHCVTLGNKLYSNNQKI